MTAEHTGRRDKPRFRVSDEVIRPEQIVKITRSHEGIDFTEFIERFAELRSQPRR